MAHFARTIGGIVDQVIVIDNDRLLDDEGHESEEVGQAFIASIGLDGEWIQTSYNGSTRGCYAGIGTRWDGENFTPPEITEEI